ncbi:hypothetical protein HZH68_012010 [Vespula germanica]|uniref:Uncharacterized protein n=1 Tax=Vespula germanica TaxID=30212 RepID=A0A834N0Y5_VESGE|nr:hypothetical protein HZH68_012010 [Vespula germanica]
MTATATATATAWRVQDEESKSPLEAVKAARQGIGGARCQLYDRNSRTVESPSGAKILALRNHEIFRSNVHTFPTFVRVYLSRSPMELVGYRYPTEAVTYFEKWAKLETKALKAKRPGFTDERYNETSYYVENVKVASTITGSAANRCGNRERARTRMEDAQDYYDSD